MAGMTRQNADNTSHAQKLMGEAGEIVGRGVEESGILGCDCM